MNPRGGIGLVAVLVSAAVSVACRDSVAPAVATAAPAPRAVVWRTLGTWSGQGSLQTGSFDVSTGAMRLRWDATRERAPGEGHLTVTLHSAISGRPLQTVVDHAGPGGASVSVADEPRTSYLDVQAEGLDWRLTLEEALAVGPGPARRP